MGNDHSRSFRDMANTYNGADIDVDTQRRLNSGSIPINDIPLGFHAVHGSNITVLSNSRIARRKESFCKGLAFSNRPVAVDENICLRLNEVSTNWSGVLRFGVSNFDPESYRNEAIPKFACPDLTTKDGYWAKALPERFSVEGNILHFYINPAGELHYGINGSQKGLFLTGIKTHLPMWIMVDIYGNSVALEFIDASEFRFRRSNNLPLPPTIFPIRSHTASPNVTPSVAAVATSTALSAIASSSELASSVSSFTSALGATSLSTPPLYFHETKGRNISFNVYRNVATREQSEYDQGYIFTERPIKNNEKVIISITNVQPLYEGGLAFGVTCCNPSTIRPDTLPSDSSDLVNLPDYWVGVKDIALQPKLNTLLTFWITDSDAGEVKFEIDKKGPRTAFFVDNSLPLYMYFDLYGSTISVKLLGVYTSDRAVDVTARLALSNAQSESTNRVPLSIPTRPAREAPPAPVGRNSSRSSAGSSGGLRVNVRDTGDSSSTSSVPPIPTTTRPVINLMDDDIITPSRQPPPIAPRTRRTDYSIDPILSSTTTTSRPPAFQAPPVPAIPAVSVPSMSEMASSSSADQESENCVVCLADRINSVLYMCGHMCMCYDCARTVSEKPNATCPICRAEIRDVIKAYKAV